jgi:membrane protease YdiL (CAAX protease family)
MKMADASGASAWRHSLSVFPDLWIFVRQPVLRVVQSRWDRDVFQRLVFLVLFDAMLTLPITWLLTGYDSFIEDGLSRELPSYVAFEDDSFFEMLVFAVLIAPLFEEVLFRGWLTGKWKHLLIGGAWMIWIVFGSFIITIDDSDEAGAMLAISMIVLLIVTTSVLLVKRKDQRLSPVLEKQFAGTFWTSSAIFGLVHLTNYEYDNYWLVIPYVFPQFLAGIVWGYARINYGLWAGILLHAASNFWIVCLYFGLEGNA